VCHWHKVIRCDVTCVGKRGGPATGVRGSQPTSASLSAYDQVENGDRPHQSNLPGTPPPIYHPNVVRENSEKSGKLKLKKNGGPVQSINLYLL